MNERIKELAEQTIGANPKYAVAMIYASPELEKFAALIVQDCADFVRVNYDHEDAELIAWNMEIKYGLHGDYA